MISTLVNEKVVDEAFKDLLSIVRDIDKIYNPSIIESERIEEYVKPTSMTKSRGKTRKKSTCKHNKSRYRCKDCNGVGICVHGRQKTQCKECEGSAICGNQYNFNSK